MSEETYTPLSERDLPSVTKEELHGEYLRIVRLAATQSAALAAKDAEIARVTSELAAARSTHPSP